MEAQMHDHDLVGRYQQRIDDHQDDRQALVDIHLELQLDLRISHDDEHALQARIEDLLERLGGWGDVLPRNLEPCPYCDKVRDRRPGWRLSACLCAGITCRYCRAGRIHRPISDHYERSDHRCWHTPYFGQYAACRGCHDLAQRVHPDSDGSWPPSGETPELSVILGPVREAAHSLDEAGHGIGDDPPAHDLVALHGGVEDWHSLRLGAPPDGRPLYVGRHLDGLDLRWSAGGLFVAYWKPSKPGVDLQVTLRELAVRWRPPLNTDVPTPWRPA
jgi:hypothetical protein